MPRESPFKASVSANEAQIQITGQPTIGLLQQVVEINYGDTLEYLTPQIEDNEHNQEFERLDQIRSRLAFHPTSETIHRKAYGYTIDSVYSVFDEISNREYEKKIELHCQKMEKEQLKKAISGKVFDEMLERSTSTRKVLITGYTRDGDCFCFEDTRCIFVDSHTYGNQDYKYIHDEVRLNSTHDQMLIDSPGNYQERELQHISGENFVHKELFSGTDNILHKIPKSCWQDEKCSADAMNVFDEISIRAMIQEATYIGKPKPKPPHENNSRADLSKYASYISAEPKVENSIYPSTNILATANNRNQPQSTCVGVIIKGGLFSHIMYPIITSTEEAWDNWNNVVSHFNASRDCANVYMLNARNLLQRNLFYDCLTVSKEVTQYDLLALPNAQMFSRVAVTHFGFHVSARTENYIAQMMYKQATDGKIALSKSLKFNLVLGGTIVLNGTRKCIITVKFHLEDNVMQEQALFGSMYDSVDMNSDGGPPIFDLRNAASPFGAQSSSSKNGQHDFAGRHLDHFQETPSSSFVMGSSVTEEIKLSGTVELKNLSCWDHGRVPMDYLINIIATRTFVMTGGIDHHTHLVMEYMGSRTITETIVDYFGDQATALVGGTTMHSDFVILVNGSLSAGFEACVGKAKWSCMDYGFHMVITKWNDAVPNKANIMVKEKQNGDVIFEGQKQACDDADPSCYFEYFPP